MVDIGKLQTHVQWIEKWMVGLGMCLLLLAGFSWHSYDALTSQVSNFAVNQQGLSGKVDTLDAKLSGKLDLIGQRLDDNSQRSAGSETHGGVSGPTVR
ncbi:hypothetical protein [Sphingomonas sp.]|uniref:hypothetical protein n=1 Tax=Sphingomonas sp. TaxID=28214 RepID=UPI00375301DE